jgi:hypothetical protein
MTVMKPRREAAMILASLVLAACTACSLGGSEAETTGTATARPDSWITYRDRERGFSISYPSSWRRAQTSLTPNRTEPRELVSVGTNPLVATPGDMSCAQASARALRALGDTGALISVVEVSMGDVSTHPSRPDTFTLRDGSPGEAVACVHEPRFTARVIFFRDNGRAFFYAVFLGKNASATTRREATGVLNSLRVFGDIANPS